MPPRLSLSAIESLTVSELYYNPHYRQLRQEYDRLSGILEVYRDLVCPPAANNSIVSNIYQAITQSSVNSRSLSLGPSDSTSQQTRPTDFKLEAAVKKLLELVEPPVQHPRCLPKLVLWDYEDCNDAAEGVIITEANKRRPKMNFAIRRGDGTNISNQEYINTDPNSTVLLANKLQIKSTLKKTFGVEYRQVILDLEAEQKILRLCSAHWKADAVIGQALLQHSKVEAKAASNCTAKPSSEVKDSQPSEPLAAFVLQASARNAVKWGFVQSPGPKSPSAALPPQKRIRDVVSGKKTTGHPRCYDSPEKQRPAEPIILHFLAAPITSLRKLHQRSLVLSLSSQLQKTSSQSMPSEQVTVLLEQVQFSDPALPDIDEDNVGQSWGHYQFTAGGISPSSLLTSWEDVGNVATAFKLVAAGLKTCQEAQTMCMNAGRPKTAGFISDIYLEQILDHLEKCWTDTGGTLSSQCRAVVPTTPTPPSSYCEVARASVSPRARLVKLPFKKRLYHPSAAQRWHRIHVGALSRIGQDVLSLKLLQVPELHGIFANMKPGAPKPKCKDDLVVVILNSPKFASVSQATIQDIVEKHKLKKGPSKQDTMSK
ncbi:hypothetical protein EI94DRAFT_1703023 [Lactarius quietus]|nr:hypothetical protein EI94DRAFT_1703023 [Lactarius quietus]